jgi:hypothetical protein
LDRVSRVRVKIHQDGVGYISSAMHFITVDMLMLEVRVTMADATWVLTMHIGDEPT